MMFRKILQHKEGAERPLGRSAIAFGFAAMPAKRNKIVLMHRAVIITHQLFEPATLAARKFQ
jgi:hypothetical protein